MFRKINLFILAILTIAPAGKALDLSALEGMLSNDSLFDGGGGGFEAWGGGGWDDFGGDTGGGWSTPAAPVKKKEAPKLKEVASDKERFLQDMPDGTEKLPKKHKEVAREYLDSLVQEIRGLHTELTSMKLSIALQESLRETAGALPPALEKIELVSSKSSYLLTLFRKEFNGVRKKIMSTTSDAVKARGAFIDMPAPSADSNDFFASPAPSSRQRRAQDDAKKKTDRLVSGPLKRLLTDLDKIINHDATKRSLEAKKKDHAAPKESAGSGNDGWGGESFAGGWDDGSFASDAWASKGFGGGWGDDGDFFGSNFGSSDWDNSLGNNWGGGWPDSDWSSSSYSGDDWGGSTASIGDEGDSAPTMLGGGETKSAQKEVKRNSELTGSGLRLDDASSLQGEQRIEHLAQKLTPLLKNWQDRLATAQSARDKQKVIRAMLIDKTFAKSETLRELNELVEIIGSGEEPTDASVARALDAFSDQLLASSPLIIHGVKYTIPLLGNEQEAQELYAAQDAAAEKKSLAEARKAVATRVRVRQQTEKFLTKVLETIARRGDEKLQKKIETELAEYEASRLTMLEGLSRQLPEGPLSLGDSANMLLASRGILSRPTSLDMAQLLETGAGKEKLKERVHVLHKQLSKNLAPHLRAFKTIMGIMDTALPSGGSVKTDEEKTAVATKVEAGIQNSTLSSEEKKQAKDLLLPPSVGLWHKSKALMLAHLKTAEAWHEVSAAQSSGAQPSVGTPTPMPHDVMPMAPAPGSSETVPPASGTGQIHMDERMAALAQKFATISGPPVEAAPIESASGEMGPPAEGMNQQEMFSSLTSNPQAMAIAEKMQSGELSQDEAIAHLQGTLGT